jgi:diguanylate cyclase (GGDEF)-like protein/PAS domain S-box-containing protein
MEGHKKQLIKISSFYRRALDTIYNGVYFVDRNKRILFWNEGAERILGYSREEIEGRHCLSDILKHTDKKGRHLCKNKCPLFWCLKNKLPKSERLYVQTKSGERLPVDIHVVPVLGKNKSVIGAIEVFRDASALERLEKSYQKIRHLSLTDSLTSLLNKRAINQRIDAEIKRAQRYKFFLSLAIADIDFFKKINDTYGHQVGDSVLKQMALLFTKNLRSVDTVGRIGGDEFIIVFPHTSRENAFIPIERLRKMIEQFKFKKISNNITVSFGIAELKDAEDKSSLVKRADDYLYKAKNLGRNMVIAESH